VFYSLSQFLARAIIIYILCFYVCSASVYICVSFRYGDLRLVVCMCTYVRNKCFDKKCDKNYSLYTTHILRGVGQS